MLLLLARKLCRALVADLALAVVVAAASVLAQPLLPWSELPASLDMMFPFGSAV
jgi:hypothetical protein